jgi:hypothetical protein
MTNKEEDFPEWEKLERFCVNGHKPKKEGRELIKIAKDWLPYDLFFDGSGLCWAGAPFGEYGWEFCVALEQEKIWNFKEFQEGSEFGHNSKEPFRDANPYRERSRKRSWDCGYILGLSERDLKADMESKAKRGEIEGVTKNAVYDKKGKLFLDHF